MLLQRPCPGCGGTPVRRRSVAGGLCPACRGAAQPVGRIGGLPGLDRCGALYRYRGPIQRALVAAKFGARRDTFAALGLMLGELAEDLGFDFDAVTWVPASHSGRRDRGYDQGRLLAVALSRRTGVPPQRLLARQGRVGPPGRRGVAGGVGWRTHRDGDLGGLGRGRGRDGRQTGRGRHQRLSGPSLGAVRPARGRVLVVDDVITTGSSIVIAADRLRAAGAASVLGLAVAWTASDREVAAGRPLPPPPPPPWPPHPLLPLSGSSVADPAAPG